MHGKRRAQEPLDAISCNALAVLFPHADRHGELLCGKIDERERLRIRPFPCPKYRGDLFFLFQPQIFHGVALRGDVLSALVSSSLEHLSAARGRHSLAEAVNLASLSLLGLIRSFHDPFSLY